MEDADHPWRYDSTLEMYSKNSGSWAAIPLEYCRITAAGLGKLFRQWDTVTVQGAAAETAGQSPELNGDQIVYDMGEDWLRVRCTPQGEYFTAHWCRTPPPRSGRAWTASNTAVWMPHRRYPWSAGCRNWIL